MVKLPFLLLLSVATAVYGHHILCIHGGLSKSHDNLVAEIANILLKAGHEVTYITMYPQPNPPKNLHYVDVSGVLELFKDLDITVLDIWKLGYLNRLGLNVTHLVLKTPAVQQAMIKNNYDAVVSEWIFSDLEAGYAAVQKIPWIVLCGTMIHPQLQQLVEIPRDLPVSPVLGTDFVPPMNFAKRLLNTVIYFRTSWKQYLASKSKYEEIFAPISKGRGMSLPPFYDALYNVSIILLNSHPSYAKTYSLPPNVVEVGGYHIPDEEPPLPKDLKDILDASPQGVIYFSMGSNIKAANLKEKTKQDLINIFKNVSQTVLWKFDVPLKDFSKNVHIRRWMPQTRILAHPNVKVFITHSGLLSTIEAVKFGVPMVTIPTCVDQYANSQQVVKAGHGIEVKFSPDMAEDILKALKEILSNESYGQRAKETSRLFHNRPVDPKKLILHYIELAVETKGAPHLRLSHELAWYELLMLDQIAFLLLVVYIMFKLVQKIKNLIINTNAKIKLKNH